jgi:hypothetical protein
MFYCLQHSRPYRYNLLQVINGRVKTSHQCAGLKRPVIYSLIYQVSFTVQNNLDFSILRFLKDRGLYRSDRQWSYNGPPTNSSEPRLGSKGSGPAIHKSRTLTQPSHYRTIACKRTSFNLVFPSAQAVQKTRIVPNT